MRINLPRAKKVSGNKHSNISITYSVYPMNYAEFSGLGVNK